MKPLSKPYLVWILAILLLGLSAAIAFQIHSATKSRAARAAVYYLLGMEWWDGTETPEENERRRIEGLKSLGRMAVETLRRDLHYDPVRPKLLARFPKLHWLIPAVEAADSPNEVRHRAAYYLGRLGTPANDAIPDLLPLMSDSDGRVRFEVAFTLGRLGVNSLEVRRALEGMLTDTDRDARFSAAISLWRLDRSNPVHFERVKAMISPEYLSWPSICMKNIGPDAAVFGPALRISLSQVGWSMSRAQAVQAVWFTEGDKPFVLSELASLEVQAITNPGATNSSSGRTDAENNIASITLLLLDQREFRDRIRPMLRSILENPGSMAHRFSEVYLKRFDDLDLRESGAPGSAKPAASASKDAVIPNQRSPEVPTHQP